MARQINTQLVGSIGSIIFYKSGNDYLMRSKGNTGRQAEVAKQQAGILGKASAISAKLRTAFKPLIPELQSRKIMYSLNNVLQQWLRNEHHKETAAVDSISLLQGFVLNNTTLDGFYVTMPVTRAEDGELYIQIPAFDSPNPIYPLPFEGHVYLNIIAASCNVTDPGDIISYATELDIAYDGTPIESRSLKLPLQTRPGSLTVVTVSVNNATAGIVGALYN